MQLFILLKECLSEPYQNKVAWEMSVHSEELLSQLRSAILEKDEEKLSYVIKKIIRLMTLGASGLEDTNLFTEMVKVCILE